MEKEYLTCLWDGFEASGVHVQLIARTKVWEYNTYTYGSRRKSIIKKIKYNHFVLIYGAWGTNQSALASKGRNVKSCGIAWDMIYTSLQFNSADRIRVHVYVAFSTSHRPEMIHLSQVTALWYNLEDSTWRTILCNFRPHTWTVLQLERSQFKTYGLTIPQYLKSLRRPKEICQMVFPCFFFFNL